MKRISFISILFLLLVLAPVPAIAQTTYNVGIIRWDPADIYFNGVQLGQEMEALRLEDEEGVNIEFTVFGANDASEQFTALQAQMARGMDGYLISPWRGEALTGIVQELHDQGIPVVVHNNFVPGAPQVWVAFDNYQAGVTAGEAWVATQERLHGEDWAEDGGVILILRCLITAAADIGRYEGYRSVIDPYLEQNSDLAVEVIEAHCDGGEGRSAVDDVISRYGEENFLGVMSIDGTMGVGGAVPALSSRNMLFPVDDERHIPIVTVDATYPELQAIVRGELDASSVQPATGEGIISMRLLYQMMSTGEFLDTPDEMVTLEDEGELWQPVTIVPNGPSGEDFEGPWYRLNNYAVPIDVEPQSPALWANFMYFNEHGYWPVYSSK
jgi:ribose transport system substrate-binding protein